MSKPWLGTGARQKPNERQKIEMSSHSLCIINLSSQPDDDRIGQDVAINGSFGVRCTDNNSREDLQDCESSRVGSFKKKMRCKFGRKHVKTASFPDAI